jgi:hypothetical protein
LLTARDAILLSFSRPDFQVSHSLLAMDDMRPTQFGGEKAQMFSNLGHNGEIKSIDRLRRERHALGFQLPNQASELHQILTAWARA